MTLTSGLIARWRGRRPLHALAGVMLGILVLAGCGPSSHTTAKPPLPTTIETYYQPSQDPNRPEIALWRHNVLVIGVVTTSSFPSDLGQQVADAVSTILKQHTNLTTTLTDPDDQEDADGVSTTAIFGTTASVTVRIRGASSNKDAALRAADQVNYAVAQSNGIVLPHAPDVRIVGASPNWFITPLAGTTQAGGSPAGPPTWPSPAPTSPAHNAPTSTAGSGTTVYVLDTADPVTSSPATLPAALSSVCAASSAGSTTPCTSMLADLGSGGGAIDETYQTFSPGLEKVRGTFGYDTSAREHGLFITAMIHHVAPAATIHQIRVLNDYGVGDMTTLLNGLASVYAAAHAANSGHTILNLSLELQPPFGCMLDLWRQQGSDGPQLWDSDVYYDAKTGLHHFGSKEVQSCAGKSASQVLSSDQSYRENIVIPLGLALQQVIAQGVQVVAATGNDSSSGGELGDGLPAAYCGVKAVAATQAAGSSALAPFSNAPSLPGGQCLQVSAATVAFTGRPPSDELQADGMNICSLYLQTDAGEQAGLPPGASDDNTDAGAPLGMVQWSGTSFASAFISGNYAAGTLPGSGGTTLDESQPCTVPSS